jgi:glyoxylase-like metal-dependent hydrolase (beta-lactamase superfamily II)
MNARITKLSDSLFLITLPPPVIGFTDFICVWLYRGSASFLVDVGPSVMAPDLIQALHHLHITHLDYIFLTHIHLDHAGGIGEIAEHFSSTPIICHSAAIPHLTDPSKLMAGTIKTLGDKGRAYGPIKPVSRKRLMASNSFHSPDMFIIPTLGHSPHHFSLKAGEYLFAGEAGGVHITINATTDYMRPATPPIFFSEVTMESIDRLIKTEPEYICYGHYGQSGDAVEMLKKHRGQLLLWEDIIKDEMDKHGETIREEKIMARLLAEDPLLSGFSLMEDDVKERERFFLANSIKGFVQSFTGI